MTTNALQAVLDRAAQQAATETPPRARNAPQPRVPRERAPEKAGATAAAEPRQEGTASARSPKSSRPSRDGQRFVGAHFHPEVARQLKMLAVEDGTTIQELLEQAVDLLFVKSGKAKIAEIVPKG